MASSKGRLPAAATCLKNGWKAGDLLTSKDWKLVKRITGTIEKGDINVRLVSLRDGRGFQEEYPRTLPPDVRLLDARVQSSVGD